jgi:uncharacterized protein (DUF302 family)
MASRDERAGQDQRAKEATMTMDRVVLLLALFVVMAAANAAEGLVTIKSAHSVKDTVDRFERLVKDKELNVFARIDHAAGAKKIGKNLRPTQLLIFGNPQGGTPLMACAQSIGIDLPLKALAWEDSAGQVWLAYNDPQYLVRRHGISDCGLVAGNMRKALDGFAQKAAAK